MSKDKLSIASTDPVSLEDPTPVVKSEVSNAKDVNDAEDTTKSESPKVAAKDDSKAELKPKTVETESVAKETAKDEEEDAPPPPARPLSPSAQIKKDLKDAFPQIEDKYIEAMLIASEGRADPAFNALLYLLDPSFKPEPVLTARSEPVAKQPTLTDDELLARQLQKEFEREDRRRRSRSHRQKNLPPAPENDSPDEFEQIKESFTQGFEEAKTTLNSWVSGLSKKFGLDEDGPRQQHQLRPGHNQSPKLFGALGGSSFNINTKKGKNFDEDPEILALDFRKNVDLDDDKAPVLPKREHQAKKEDKWQPLNSDVPVNSDAFLVTDLEDEDKDKKWED